MRAALGVLLGLVMVLVPAIGTAQPRGASVVTLDQQRLFEESAYGQAVLARIEASGQALAQENRRIESELRAEEQALTEAREDMDPDAFRDRARAFDEKVTRIRAERDAEARALIDRRERAQADFFERALPILTDLLAELDASVVIETGVVVLSQQRVDITDRAIDRVDARLDPPPVSGAPGRAPPAVE